MASNKQNVVRENKSLEEFDMTEINEAIASMPHIYYGTEAPSDSLGQDGDIYVRYSN